MLGRLLDRKLRGLGAPEYLIDIVSGAAKQDGAISTVRHQSPGIDVFAKRVHGGQPVLGCKRRNLPSVLIHEEAPWNQNGLSLLLCLLEGAIEPFPLAHPDETDLDG